MSRDFHLGILASQGVVAGGIHITISKDNTCGEEARQADLFAYLGTKSRCRPSLCTRRPGLWGKSNAQEVQDLTAQDPDQDRSDDTQFWPPGRDSNHNNNARLATPGQYEAEVGPAAPLTAEYLREAAGKARSHSTRSSGGQGESDWRESVGHFSDPPAESDDDDDIVIRLPPGSTIKLAKRDDHDDKPESIAAPPILDGRPPRRLRRVYCAKCNEHPQGFLRDSDLRMHNCTRHGKYWICQDPPDSRSYFPQPRLPLSQCKYCLARKAYETRDDALAHLEESHFFKQGEIKAADGTSAYRVAIPIPWTVEVDAAKEDLGGSDGGGVGRRQTSRREGTAYVLPGVARSGSTMIRGWENQPPSKPVQRWLEDR